ncbi:hypothetical protein BACFIN_05722 [Bacteroides finegoldii DSM 17565]|nr:hypothetical protein BACFIN_05722 [Bacteroides finegoldii DSM 17565]
MAIKPVIIFLILLCLIGVLWHIIGYWRRKAREAAYVAARMADNAEERDRYCRLAVMTGHRDACRMFCFLHPDLFEDHLPLTLFKSRGIRMAFYGHYYPSRYHELLSEEQRAFCRSSTCSRMAKRTASSFSRRACLPYRRTRSLTISC